MSIERAENQIVKLPTFLISAIFTSVVAFLTGKLETLSNFKHDARMDCFPKLILIAMTLSYSILIDDQSKCSSYNTQYDSYICHSYYVQQLFCNFFNACLKNCTTAEKWKKLFCTDPQRRDIRNPRTIELATGFPSCNSCS